MIARGERTIGSSVETVALRAAPDRSFEVQRALGVGGPITPAGAGLAKDPP
jgi:hypothetical protein